MTAHLVDDRGGVVLLLLGRKPFALVENKISPGSLPFLRFFGLGMGVMNSARRRFSMICLGRLPLLIEFPMPLRAIIRRVQDRMFKERVGCGLGP